VEVHKGYVRRKQCVVPTGRAKTSGLRYEPLWLLEESSEGFKVDLEFWLVALWHVAGL
jgi:hypothetical protein